jgi:redox-sensing transcriptional repressor
LAYLRALTNMPKASSGSISSENLAEYLGLSDASVRRDLAYFGKFGTPGVGYKADELKQSILEVMSGQRLYRGVLIGVGNLGAALLAYKGLQLADFDIAAAFDQDPEKIGNTVGSVKILNVKELPRFIQKEGIEIAILTVPAQSAQAVADMVVAAGVKGILNFAPVNLTVPEDVLVSQIDLGIELETLLYFLKEQTNSVVSKVRQEA